MDGSTILGVRDKAKNSDGSSLTDLDSTPDLPDNYREYLSIGVGDLATEPTNEPISASATGILVSISQPVALTTGSEAVLHARFESLSDQPTSAPAAKVSKEEDAEPAGDLAEAIRATSSPPPGSSKDASPTAATASISVQNDSLPGIPKHHHVSDWQRNSEISPKDGLSQNTELLLTELDPSARESQKQSDIILGIEQPEKSLFNAPAGVLPSTFENAHASPVLRRITSQDGMQTTASSSLSSHSHMSGPSSAFSEISSQDETSLDSSVALPTTVFVSPSVAAEPTVHTPQDDVIRSTHSAQSAQGTKVLNSLPDVRSGPAHPSSSYSLLSSPKRASMSRRPTFKIRPKSSIPSDLTPQEYAGQCIAAAESSRLNPYALHEEEHAMLRCHISHAQVTAYLNIRNGILRLWLRKPSAAITKNEAMGCARDKRWFGAAGVCFDWLVRRGYVNFGCVDMKEPPKDKSATGSLPRLETMATPLPHRRKKTIAIIGAGMAGLGCARQLDNLFKQYHGRFIDLDMEVPNVVILEGRDRIGGRVYSRPFQVQTRHRHPDFHQSRCTAEMGGMIVTGFDRGNPMNTLIRGQLGLGYHALRTATTIYDISGKPVDEVRDGLVENLFNECLDRVSEYKFKVPLPKVVEGNHAYIDDSCDNTSEGHPTIAFVEEIEAVRPSMTVATEVAIATEEQTTVPPHATMNDTESPGLEGTTAGQAPGAEEPSQADLIPVSSDRLTGRAHLEPGTHATLNAAHKLKSMGWSLKPGVLESRDLDLDLASKTPSATLGSVVEDAIKQYGELVDLNSQDFRLLNWHIANLEYSNAINHNCLSLKGWDIDAGNEWEGKHSMIIGGYQSVPRGLMLCPTPLDVRRQMAVKKIIYNESDNGAHAGHVEQEEAHKSPVVIEFEHGGTFEADYVVSTIPLGVLKHGNVEFDPPLPGWKSDSIGRLGYGVLNKIILTYRQAFWDTERDIFGVLREPANRFSLDQKQYSQRRGRMFQWFNVSRTTGIPCLVALMAGDAAFDTEKVSNDELVAEATSVLRCVFGSGNVPEPIEAVVTRWASDKFSRGSYSSAGPKMEFGDYDSMARSVGRHLHFAGEHTIGTHPATVHGAYLSGLRAASDIFEELVGPIDIPTPLIPLKETLTSAMKRKLTLDEDEGKAGDESSGSISTSGGGGSNYRDAKTNSRKRLEARETRIQQHIYSQIGDRPSQLPRMSESSYSLFSKANYERARKKCEEGRRPGKGRSTPNEVRVLTSKMWRSASAEERRPFADQAAAQKRMYEVALGDYSRRVAEWDRRAAELYAADEKGHPKSSEQDAERTPQTLSPSVSDRVATTPDRPSPNGGHRLRRMASYQAGNDSDVDMSG